MIKARLAISQRHTCSSPVTISNMMVLPHFVRTQQLLLRQSDLEIFIYLSGTPYIFAIFQSDSRCILSTAFCNRCSWLAMALETPDFTKWYCAMWRFVHSMIFHSENPPALVVTCGRFHLSDGLAEPCRTSFLERITKWFLSSCYSHWVIPF